MSTESGNGFSRIAIITQVDLFDLRRPDHVADEAWTAIDTGLRRLKLACEMDDLHEVIGKSKELVETVARVAIDASDGTVANRADLDVVVSTAHKQLRRSVGPDTDQDENLRAMANAARTLATKIAPLRNAFGTGHGRASVPPVAQEMADVVLEGALLWCRWALRRLGHLLADYPNDLIAAVHTGTSERTLRDRFAAATLPQQDPQVQRSIGVAFGRESAGGFGNATTVGVNAVIDAEPGERDRLYPVPYRHGVIEGMLFTAGGSFGLTDFNAGRVVNLVATLPEGPETSAFLEGITETAASATWPTHWRKTTPVEAAKVVKVMEFLAVKLPTHVRPAFEDLCEVMAVSVGVTQSEPDSAS